MKPLDEWESKALRRLAMIPALPLAYIWMILEGAVKGHKDFCENIGCAVKRVWNKE